jgi:hypothetical protein
LSHATFVEHFKAEDFRENIDRDIISTLINDLDQIIENKSVDNKSIDDVMSKLGRIFSVSALKSFGRQTRHYKIGNKRLKPWFNSKCNTARKNFHLPKHIHER